MVRSITEVPIVGFVYDRYNKASATQPAEISWRVYYQLKVKVVSTGIRVFPNEWDKPRQRVVNRVDAMILNKQLERLLTDIRKVVYDMYDQGYIDIHAIEGRLKALRKPVQTFLDFCEERAKIRKYGKAADSQERYERFLRFLREYGKIKTFYDLTENKVMELDKHLMGKNNMKAKSRWNNYHRFLNSFILDAQKDGRIQVNPYDKVKIDHGDDSDGIDKFLFPDEFEMLRTAEMPSERLERIRDLFVFQTYTCLAYTDLADFSMRKVRDTDFAQILSGKRGKTNIEYVVPLKKHAKEILVKYNGLPLPLARSKKEKGDIMTNQRYNDGIKEVAKEVGLNRPVQGRDGMERPLYDTVSSHWARHTGATLLLNDNVPIEVVSRFCGHSSIKQTERIYAKLLQRTIAEKVLATEEKTKNKNK